MSKISQPRWKEVEYSCTKIIKSGKIIRKEDITHSAGSDLLTPFYRI